MQLANLVPVLWFCGRQGWLMLLLWRTAFNCPALLFQKVLSLGQLSKVFPPFFPHSSRLLVSNSFKPEVGRVYARMLWILGGSRAVSWFSIYNMPSGNSDAQSYHRNYKDHSFLNYVIKSKSVFVQC